jgi:hypothetical protein
LSNSHDENQASASARSARASLLHRWEDSSDAPRPAVRIAMATKEKADDPRHLP